MCLAEYVFIIKTSSSTTQIDRDMTAFITGRQGDSGASPECLKAAEEELSEYAEDWFDNAVSWIPGECGDAICEPWYNNKLKAWSSVAIFLSEEPEEDIAELMKIRAIRFAEMTGIKILGFELISQEVVETTIWETEKTN
jgi:hypothetical protein